MLIAQRHFLRPALYACLVISAAGCARLNAPGYYDVPHDSTYSDAQKQAQGPAEARAPSQVQLGFGDQANKPSQAPAGGKAAAAASELEMARPLREPKTFLGTVPCLGTPATCTANRFTLTLAPSGEWRSRSVPLGSTTTSSLAQQGCWHVIGTNPLKILLQLNNETPKASLTFVNDNVLRIDSLDGVAPNLEYRLTRQADIDGIDELKRQAVLNCRKK